jgi:beta-galactosidase/beta-glucuronidase
MAREGFHRTWFNFGGINREVTLRAIGDSELINPKLQTRLAPASDGSVAAIVNVNVYVRNNTRQRAIAVTGTLADGDQTINLAFPPVTLAPGASTLVHALTTVNNPALWAPGHPSLYDLDLKVGDETEYRARVGLREIQSFGGRLYLNGKRLVLRGASIQEDIRGHGDALTPADQATLIDELRAVHANATRSQHPLDVGLLERLDAAGILVWQGIGPVDSPGSWNSVGTRLTRLAERRARVTVHQAQLHPSIIAWNLANEVAGNGHPGGQITYIEETAATLHKLDPGRLVAVDVWGPHPPHLAGPTYANVDAIGETNYLGWYEDPYASTTALHSAIDARLASLRRVFPNKVLIVSEFGAESNFMNHGDRPGSYAFQANLLRLHIGAYAGMPSLSGMLVWDMRDFALAPTFAGGSIRHSVGQISLIKGLNQKGLVNYEGHDKPAFAVVADAFAKLRRSASY